MTRIRLALVPGLFATLLAGATVSGPPASAKPLDYEWKNRPSPVRLHLGERDVTIRPWSYCWDGPIKDGMQTSVCVDGVPPAVEDLRRAGEQRVRFEFGMPKWTFSASLTSDDEACDAAPEVVKTTRTRFVVRPHADACTYRASLFGRGPQGDVSVDFRWTVGPAD